MVIYWSWCSTGVLQEIREIKSHVYGKPLTSDSSEEFLKIENKQINTAQSISYG